MTDRAPDERGSEPRPIPITPDMLAPGGPRTGASRPAARPSSDQRVPGLRVDFERGMSYAPPLTLALLLTLCTIFTWQVAGGTLASVESITDAGALVRANVLAGEWWRMITAIFLHGGLDHLLGNAISLYTLGMACEHAFGTPRYAATYVVAGLGGSVFSTLLSPGPSVGASGAIFGLMGALIAFLIKHQDRFHVRDKRVGIVLLAWAGFTLALGLTTPFVDNGAHIGGMLTGIVAGLLVQPRLPERRHT